MSGCYLLRVLPASDFSHRVERVSIWQSLGSHCESDHDFLPPLRHTPHQLSILHSDTGCRDALHSILVVLPTCVWTTNIQIDFCLGMVLHTEEFYLGIFFSLYIPVYRKRSDRSNECGHSSHFSCLRGSICAVSYCLPIADKWLIKDYNPPCGLTGSLLQLLKRLNHQHLCLDTWRNKSET